MAQDQRAAQGRRDPRQEQDDYLNMLTLAGSEVRGNPALSSPYMHQNPSPYMLRSHAPLLQPAAANESGYHNRSGGPQPGGYMNSYQVDNFHLPSEPVWPNFNPGYPPTGYPSQSGQMPSRLPDNNVGRKAPRKGTPNILRSSHTPAPLLQSTVQDDYRRQHNASQSLQHQQSSSIGRSEPAQQAFPTQNVTAPLQDRPNPLPTATRGRRRNLNNDSNHDELPPRQPIKRSRRERSPEISTPTPASNRRGMDRQQPRTRYKYTVPTELESIQRALGEDSWTYYLVLVEQKVLGEITEDWLFTQSKKLFEVFDDRVRNKIEREVTNKMVMPAIRQQREEA